MCGQVRSGSGMQARGKAGEEGRGGFGGQARREQPRVARLEVELGGEVGLPAATALACV
jgi:hypothetical protein